jgi:tRNA A37 threonylcarbamoyladenosine biosynthesis protein TsaE
MGFGSARLQFLEVLVELVERVILVVLSGDIGAQLAEFGQLLLQILSGRLDVRLNSL